MRSPYAATGTYCRLRRGRAGSEPPPVPPAALATMAWHDVEAERHRALFELSSACALDWRGPRLVYSRELLTSSIVELAQLGARHGVDFLLAVKSIGKPESPLLAVLDLALEHLSGFDISNAAELALLPALGGRRVSFTGPIWPTDPELARLLARAGSSLRITVGSVDHVERLEGSRVKEPLDLMLRLDSAALLGSEPKSRFGLCAGELPDVLARIRALGTHRVAGVHVHHGSEKNLEPVYLELASAAVALAERHGLQPAELNLGGGLHLLSMSRLEHLVEQLRAAVPASTRLSFEPGRLVSRDAGWAMARVESVVERDGVLDHTLDLSAECHLRWSVPDLLAPLPEGAAADRRVRFYGPTCYEADLIGEYRVPLIDPASRPYARGDVVIFAGLSGYAAAWNTGFNGVPAAGVTMLGQTAAG